MWGMWSDGTLGRDGRDGCGRSERDRSPDGRRAQSTALELALDGWRDYGNTDGRLRAMTDGGPKLTDGISA